MGFKEISQKPASEEVLEKLVNAGLIEWPKKN
jgi:hypothetical protein